MTPSVAAATAAGSASEPRTTRTRSVAGTARLWHSTTSSAACRFGSSRNAARTESPTFPVAPVTRSFMTPSQGNETIIVY